jgi:IS4 transposase
MHDMPDLEWTAEELSQFECPDARLKARAQQVLSTLEAHPTLSIPAACATEAETGAMYDFFKNAKVSSDALLASHAQATRGRLAEYRDVLLIADLTELDYTHKVVAAELGYIGDNKTRGLFCLPLLAVAVGGDVLGVAAMQFYERPTPKGTSQTHKYHSIEEKETRYILESYRQACAVQKQEPKTRLTFVHDRNGDIYEIYQEYQQGKHAHPADFLIRGREYERCLQEVVTVGGSSPTTESQTRARKLNVLLSAAPVLGTLTFTAPATPTQPARLVTQEIRSVTVTLQPPYRTGIKLQPATLNVVWCHEIAPPPGADPIDWLLYTTLPVDTAAAAEWVVARYLQRWTIELFFKILKSGCRIEQLYLQKKERLKAAIACYMIVAWRILQFTRLGRQAPEVPCTVLFSPLEWQTVVGRFHKCIPDAPPDLQTVIRLVGKLGGNLGRRGDGEPGITALWIGLSRVRDMVQGVLVYRQTQRMAVR